MATLPPRDVNKIYVCWQLLGSCESGTVPDYRGKKLTQLGSPKADAGEVPLRP